LYLLAVWLHPFTSKNVGTTRRIVACLISYSFGECRIPI
jgi:hypothetical protein